MPYWWGKTSSKEVTKKADKESFFDAIHRKFKISSEDKCQSRPLGSSRRHAVTLSRKGTLSQVPSRSSSPSSQVSRCQSFIDRPHAQPLPLPGRTDFGTSAPATPRLDRGSEPLHLLPLPKPDYSPMRDDPTDAEGDLAAGSASSDSYSDSDDLPDSRLISPHAYDYEIRNRSSLNNSSSIMHKYEVPFVTQKITEDTLKPANNLLEHNRILSKRGLSNLPMPNLHIPQHGTFVSALDSSKSSPSKSPMTGVAPEVFWAGRPYPEVPLLGSGHCSSPGSGHNSVGGDMSSQLFWQHNKCSAECSPIPSPRMTSPGPSSRVQSGAVTPLHPKAGGTAMESPTGRPDESNQLFWQHNRCSAECSPIPSPRMMSPGPSSRVQSGAVTPLHPKAGGTAMESPTGRSDDSKQRSHRLPLPPLTISNSCPFSPPYSTSTTPSVPRSPARAENPTSPGSRWKKGRLLGRGTFGHVYLGFNSDRGEMCAMKEVTLFSEDAKSKECAQQLGQEVALLSRLRHPNIVQYYGSGMEDDKLYIYLEYISGGSIYKLLQEYGQFGEIAIRSYTQQILSGLAYLHATNTVHRDIKGANILVDPNGRVKLADFGMAKHITGKSCPLSFKGSPYWMAPEVIKNSSGCNLAVDIWSLGCTVLEMATSKPPWSQYEGVAALFKIGNSKELPTIPDSLSDDGKDFVRQCLQRNPFHRPTAAKLLEHPFVKNAAPLERPILSSEPPESLQALPNPAQEISYSEPGGTMHQSRVSKASVGSSDAHTLRNKASPVSPIGSPLIHLRSPKNMSGRMSPSPISSPCTASGSSTPPTGGAGTIPFHHSKQPNYFQNGLYTSSGTSYQDRKPDLFLGAPQVSHVFWECTPAENAYLGNCYGRSANIDSREVYDGQSVLAARVSQQLLGDHMKLNPIRGP